MAETEKRTIEVDCKDLYQLLIEGCRYGYTRNNHLMPGGAFDHCRTYLPQMRAVGGDWADHTARQLAEEAIEQLRMDAFDDDRKAFSFFQDGIPGAERELKAKWTRGLYRFAITCEFKAAPGIKFSTEDGTVYAETVAAGEGMVEVKFLDFDSDPHIFHTNVYQEDDENPNYYNSLPKWQHPVYVKEGKPLAFTAEKAHRRMNIKDYVDFIDYCLEFIKGSRSPYNLSDYEDYLEKHPK